MSSDDSGMAARDLSLEATALIDDYFARFRVAALAAGGQGWDDAVVDLRAHVRDRLQGGAGMPDDAARVLAELGTVEALVAAYRDVSPDDDLDGLIPDDVSPSGTGRFLGAPYDLRVSLLAVVPAAAAVWVHLRGRRPFTRVAASAISLSFTALTLALWSQMLFTLDGGTWLWPTVAGLVLMLVLPFALLVVVSRIGRAAEQRRDLSGVSTKGCQ